MTSSTFYSLFSIFGSLAMVVLGLRVLNDRILLSQGSRIRNFLSEIGDRALKGAGTGALITGAFQSFPAISILSMSMINASSMTIQGAYSVALGSGFGQVLPLWFLAVFGFITNSTIWVLPGIALGAILTMAPKRNIARFGTGLTGIFLAMLGIGLMKNLLQETIDPSRFLISVRSLRNFPLVLSVTGFTFGIFLSFITQSSNVAFVTALCFAWTGWVPIPPVLAMMFGADLGSVLTMTQAAAVYEKDSRIFAASVTLRMFSVAITGLILVYPLESLASILFPHSYTWETQMPLILTSIYTLWLIATSIISLVFRSLFISAGKKLISADDWRSRVSVLPMIPRTMPDSLEANLITSRNEIGKMAEIAHQMLMQVLNASQEIEASDMYLGNLKKMNDKLIGYRDRVSHFLTFSLREPTGVDQARDISAQMLVNRELGDIGESCVCVVGVLERILRKKYQIHSNALDELYSFIAQFLDYLKYNGDFLDRKLRSYDSDLAISMVENVVQVRDKLRKKVRRTLERDEHADIRGELQFMEIIHFLDHIGESCLSIAKEIPNLR